MASHRIIGSLAVLATMPLAVIAYGCGPDGATPSAHVPESTIGAANYHVRREGECVNGQRKMVFVRDPRLGELSVAVSEVVPATEALELVNFLLRNWGSEHSSQAEAISSLGPLRWSVTVGEKGLLCPAGRYRVTIIQGRAELEVESIEWISNT